jgi:hypothetical protein
MMVENKIGIVKNGELDKMNSTKSSYVFYPLSMKSLNFINGGVGVIQEMTIGLLKKVHVGIMFIIHEPPQIHPYEPTCILHDTWSFGIRCSETRVHTHVTWT